MDVNNVIINQWEKNLKMASEEIDEKLFESYYSEVNHLAFFWLVRVNFFYFFPKMYSTLCTILVLSTGINVQMVIIW